MKDEQIEELISVFSEYSKGVNKIGDGVQSIATYLWLPVYVVIFLLLCAIGVCAFVYLG